MDHPSQHHLVEQTISWPPWRARKKLIFTEADGNLSDFLRRSNSAEILRRPQPRKLRLVLLRAHVYASGA